MIRFMAFIAGITLIGYLLQQVVLGKERAWSLERAAMSPALGMAALGSALVTGLVLTDRFLESLFILLPLGLAAAAVMLYLGRRSGAIGIDPEDAQHPAPSPRAFFFPLFAVAFTLILLVVSYRRGAGGDYLQVWGFKALLLTENDALRIPVFLEENPMHPHQDYPLLFPALQALLYRVSGEILDRCAMMLSPLLLLCASLALYGELRRHGFQAAAVVSGGFCLLTPSLCGYHPGACSGYMDIPLGCFTLLAFLYALRWLESGGPGHAFMAGLFLSAMSLTKNEGIAGAALALILITTFSIRKLGKKCFAGGICLLLPLVVSSLPWFLFRMHLPAGNRDYLSLFLSGDMLTRYPRLPMVMGRFLLECLHFERWGFLWILVVLTAPGWFRRGGALPGIYLAGMLLVFTAAVTLSPLHVEYQLATACSRLVSQLAPLAAACVGLGIVHLAKTGSSNRAMPS